MKKFMNYLRVAVVALTISMAMSGCSSSDEPAPAPSYNVSLVNESDAALDVDPAALSEQIIKIQTDAPLTDLSIQKVTEQSWCIATVKSTSEIAVTAGANTSTALPNSSCSQALQYSSSQSHRRALTPRT